jgi:1-acyl-sn-glycerol-3-phosphate acyltransferase
MTTSDEPENTHADDTPAPQPRRRRSRSATPAATEAQQASPAGTHVDAAHSHPSDVMAEAEQAAGVPPAADVEIEIAGAPSDATVRAAAAATVEELEVEIRNQPDSAGPQRDLAAEVLRLIRENLANLRIPAVERVVTIVREQVLSSDYLDPDFWRGLGMVLQYQADEIAGLVRRRVRGEYEIDAYGMDAELVELARPFAGFLYRTWWRVETRGIDNIPAAGPALLVANHGGVVPWDSMMIATAVLEEHAEPRLVRCLHDRWLAALPGAAPGLATFGQAPALPENAARMLGEGQPVCVFPEGARGAGKLFFDRYRLAPFDAAAYIEAAVRAGAPVVPVAVIGAEETYPILANLEPLAKLLGLPFFPLTPLFPWFGLLGLVPLPVKWTIIFDTPLALPEHVAEEDIPRLAAGMAAQARDRIQGLVDTNVAARR